MKRALILCAGKQERWQGKVYPHKHLIEFGGEPLVRRTTRQLAEYGFGVEIVCSEDIFLGQFASRLIIPETTSICGTVLATEPYWSDLTLLVCGDVLWSELAMRKLMNTGKRPCFCGSIEYGEIFAIMFDMEMAEHIKHCANHALQCEGIVKQAKLWQLFRGFIKVDLERHLIDPCYWCDVFDDLVRDFDYEIDYLTFQSQGQWEKLKGL